MPLFKRSLLLCRLTWRQPPFNQLIGCARAGGCQKHLLRGLGKVVPKPGPIDWPALRKLPASPVVVCEQALQEVPPRACSTTGEHPPRVRFGPEATADRQVAAGIVA